MKGRIHSVETFATVDGPGVRFIVFFQGCPLQCLYCHNRDTWDMSGGEEVDSEEIIEQFKRYLSFYRRSGGGMTASGGEPTLQPEFLSELFSKVRDLGVTTALNTTGYVNPDTAEIFLDNTDLVLLDLKVMDRERHRKLTGVDNKKIIEFARYLSAINKPVWIRHVIIPGYTDDREDIQTMVSFLATLDNVERVELLPYHSFGEKKWTQLGCQYPLKGVKPPDRELLLDLADNYASLGVQVTVD
ncbi:MAG TPA: pyruvate formate lyase-activating protein [Clostridia bacterium]|nr:pyruvate formate lyase-activating protein [Clostridia bacterium]